MIQKIESITKQLTKLMNQKMQKENEIEKLKNEIEKMTSSIINAENEILELIKTHQKEIKIPKKRTPKKEEKSSIEEKNQTELQ